MICPKCKREVEFLTKEHVIPKWLFNPSRLRMLGLLGSVKTNKDWSIVATKNIEYVCSPCNNNKGGTLDFSHPSTRKFVKDMIDIFTIQLEKHAPSHVTLKVICQCGTVHSHEESKKDNSETEGKTIKTTPRPTLDNIFNFHTH